MEDTEKQFTKGIFVKMPNDKAPDFILLDMSFKPHEFFTWCQDKMDAKGWVNIQVKKSKGGSIYSELNTWKSKSDTEVAKEYNDTKYKAPSHQEMNLKPVLDTIEFPEEVINLEDIPF